MGNSATVSALTSTIHKSTAQSTDAAVNPSPTGLAAGDNLTEQTACSVIVPVYNGAHTIRRCLDALARQSVPASDFEIIIVDDGSQDRTAAVVEAWAREHPESALRLLRQPNAGPAAARNHGGRMAQNPLLLFTDADCAPQPDWVATMRAPFLTDPAVAGVKGAYLTEQSGLVPRFVQAEYEDRYDRMRRLSEIDFIDTYSAGYRRDVFLRTGGFDESYPTASVEDQEFSFRLAAAGHRMVFQPGARVSHIHDPSVADYWRRKFFIGYWKAMLLRRHPERIVRDSHTPQVLKVQMLLICGVAALVPVALLGRWIKVLWWLWLPVALFLALFLITVSPLQRKLLRQSPQLSLIAPGMIAVRSLALGAGLLIGMCKFVT